MIREIPQVDYNILNDFLKKDIGRNYFILLGLSSKKPVYKKIFGQYENGELSSVLLQRLSGTLQFYAQGEFNEESYIDLITKLEYHSLIGPRSYCDKLMDKRIFSTAEDGAYIAKLDKSHVIDPLISEHKIRDISVDDLEKIMELYKGLFKSFAPREVMEKKLVSGRGRGVCIEKNDEIISVVQTDFEKGDAAVIVGVATKEEYQHKGLATECLQYLCRILLKEGKSLFLQYDNLEAGHIYEKLGFQRIDQVMHYKI